MLPRSRLIQRCLLAAVVAAALALGPLSASAASPDVDALWNQPQGVSVDSAFYVVQEWWDGVTRGAQSDPTQRGLAELAQANADLLNAYTLLQQKRSGAGPQPVAVIDPFLAGTYNFITGSHAKAPIGSVFNWANQSLLGLEGRGSTTDIVQSLLRDYRSRQAAAQRDLQLAGRNDLVALWATNADREGAFLVKIKGVAIAADGLAGLLNDAAQPTVVIAATKPAAGPAKAKATVKADQGHGANPKGDDGKPKKGD